MGKSLLLVEDEVELLSLWTEILQGSGHDVVCTSTVADACASLNQTDARFDLALVDWTLPDGNGGEVIALAQKLGNVSTLVLTSGLGHHVMGGHGADHMLAKPFRLRELLAMVVNS